jgi:ABC-type antimicrobial peptide transport system permease subunit
MGKHPKGASSNRTLKLANLRQRKLNHICRAAAMALLLACIGLYGLLAYTVAQRTREIGIRMALGAQKQQVLQRLLRDGLQLVGMGLAGGLICAFLLQRVFQSLLFGVEPTDPLTFLLTALVLLVTGLAACYLPAQRAASIDPVEALRYE